MKFVILALGLLLVVFVLSSLTGLFLAWKDIRHNKNKDNFFRKSRQKEINEKLSSSGNNSPDLSFLSAVNELSPEEQDEFRRQLLEKFNGGAL